MEKLKRNLTAFFTENRAQRAFETIAFFGAIAFDKLADRRVADWLGLTEGGFRYAFELFFFAPFMVIGFWVAQKVAPEQTSQNKKGQI